MPTTPKSNTFVVYLLKDTIRNAEIAVTGSAQLQRHDITLGDATAVLFVKPSFAHKPKWTSLFDGVLDLTALKNRSTAAVLIVPAANRLFAITFGYGKHLLGQSAYEEGFGLRTALGVTDPRSIRGMDKRTFDSIAQLTKQQASKAATAVEFGLDVERDLMQAVTGVPRDSNLGARVSGKDSIVLTVKRDLHGLPRLLEDILVTYDSKSYREHFDYIDQIDEIRDKELRSSLDSALIDRIMAGDFEKLWIAVPEIVDWSDFEGFRYSSSPRASVYEDLNIQEFVASLRDPSRLRIATLRNRYVYMASQTMDHEITKWPVYRCVYFEITRNEETFILSDAKWYRVNGDFMTEVREKFESIPFSELSLPEYEDQSETLYNERVANSTPGFALMDRKLVRYGRSSIEFSDLYTQNKQIIHVKRYGGSSVLSHLFAQGSISAQLFYTERGFREKVNEKLPPSFKLADPGEVPDTEQYEIVFAIISDSDGALELPFFSMINLANTVQRIKMLRYPVSLTKVGVASESTDGQAST